MVSVRNAAAKLLKKGKHDAILVRLRTLIMHQFRIIGGRITWELKLYENNMTKETKRKWKCIIIAKKIAYV